MKKRIFWKSSKRLFCNLLQRVGIWRPRYAYESCFLRSGLSIGGNDMATRRFKHFLWKEKHVFCGFGEKWRGDSQNTAKILNLSKLSNMSKELSAEIFSQIHQKLSDWSHSNCVRTAYWWAFQRTLNRVHTTLRKNWIPIFDLGGTLISTQF